MIDVRRRSPASLVLVLAAALGACASGGESPPPAAPPVALDVASLQFEAEVGGGDPAVQALNVANAAAPTATVSYVEGATGWLSATVTGSEVAVAVSTGGLARGHYVGAVTIEAAGASPVTVPVALDVTRPELAVSAASLTLATPAGRTPAPRTITVTNAGDGTLARPTATASTLLAATVEGTAAPFTVSVSLREPIVLEGNWTGSVTIAAANAANVLLTVPVTISVEALPIAPVPGTVACAFAGTAMCQEYTSICEAARTAYAQDCAASGGTNVCPTTGKVGGCVVSYGTASDADRYTSWYYAPQYTAADAEAICTLVSPGATWSSP